MLAQLPQVWSARHTDPSGFPRIDGDELSDVLYWKPGGFGIALATAPGVFGLPVLSPSCPILGKDLVLTEADSFDWLMQAPDWH